MRKILNSLLLAASLLAVPASAATRDDPEAELQKMLAGRSPSAPVSCINLRNTSNVTIIQGKAIVYRVASRLYVNTPDDPTPLRNDDNLISRSFGSDLCNHDVVNLVGPGSQLPHGFVMLRKFVPYSRAAKSR